MIIGKTKVLIGVAAVAILAAVLTVSAQRRSEPFVGITTDGQVVPGLFPIESTGVSTAPLVEAAQAFLQTLDDAERQSVTFAVDGEQWREWSNQHRAPRQGISFQTMTARQADAAFGMLSAALSARGLQTTRDIMRLNGHLALLTGRHDEYGEDFYWLALMGTPSATEPWGWQLEGHHLIVNCFVLGDQVVMTPTFLGSEPVYADEGPYAGIRVLEAEEQAGLDFVRSLSDEQRRAAILGDKRGNTILAQANGDNTVIPHVGLPGTNMTDDQRERFVGLIAEYIDHIDPARAAVRLQEILDHLDETWFAWVGATDDDAIYYYRIQSPVVLIEFDHQRPIALRNTEYTARDHVHSVVRTPNGNDYGRDLLRQHYEQHRLDASHVHHE